MAKRSSSSSGVEVSKRIKSSDPKADQILPYTPNGFNNLRARLVTNSLTNSNLNSNGSCVVLWMSRDQRVNDNHAVTYAQSLAVSRGVPLKVVFNVVPKFLDATIRHFGFMIKGLQEVEQTLREKFIPFHVLLGDPLHNIPEFVRLHDAMMLVTDFGPLRVGLGWVKSVAEKLDQQTTAHKIPLVQVDAHNIVPCWVASPKQEYGARTIRTKIQSRLSEFLTDMPPVSANLETALAGCDPVDWGHVLDSLEINRDVQEVDWLQPGARAAHAMLESFGAQRLKDFAEKRNDPNCDVASNLSPYLHFGQISAQRVVLYVKSLKKHPASVDSFVEELVVRRELADNFCFYNQQYDSLSSCFDWAKETLRVHSSDPRVVIYTRAQLEGALTHDDLWNAAQLQMTSLGKMHGFLRMYWAKKILEWSATPEEALATAIYLNDKYELDGRDPNGYVGCMWSIGGIHDQGWGERKVFGKIRYMNYKGCERKFNVKAFVAKFPPAAENARLLKGIVPAGY